MTISSTKYRYPCLILQAILVSNSLIGYLHSLMQKNIKETGIQTTLIENEIPPAHK